MADRTAAAPDAARALPQDGPRARRRRRLALAAGVLLAAIIAAGLVVAAPRLARGFATTTAVAPTTVELARDGDRATLELPAGWSALRWPWSQDRLRLESPDGALALDLALRESPREPSAVLAEALAPELAAAVPPSPTGAERLDTGTTILELRVAEPADAAAAAALAGPEGASTIAVAVPTSEESTGPAVEVVARGSGADDAYRGEYAAILATLAIAPAPEATP
ncbi:hypothetical protein USB125703_01310 [Pseudoclavibacter triregionum]|nr:hypothetical protein USB125703_01310 [Pseudoclavibacter triregionum]